MHNLFWEVFLNSIAVLIPLMLAVITAGVVGNVAQFGFLFTGEREKYGGRYYQDTYCYYIRNNIFFLSFSQYHCFFI